jgi:phosphonatase-like hydrolase
MIQLVVFDMAGTTIDEGNVVYKTLQKSLQEAGVPVPLEQVLAVGAGREKKDAIAELMRRSSTTSLKVEEVHHAFLDHLKRAYVELDVKACKGAERLLVFLRAQGIKVALNTGYNRYMADYLLHRLRWETGTQYDLLITADEVSPPRPAPDMIRLAQAELDVPNAGRVAKVGDSTIDIEEGKNAGCGLTVGVTTGAHSADQLREAGPDYVIDQLEDLATILQL